MILVGWAEKVERAGFPAGSSNLASIYRKLAGALEGASATIAPMSAMIHRDRFRACCLVGMTAISTLDLVVAADEAKVQPEETESSEVSNDEVEGESLPDMTVIASRTSRPWIQSSGSVATIRPNELVRDGVQDLGGIGKYDPLISAPFDYGSSDTLYGYGGSGYSGFNIRGAEGNRISLELDGIRQPPQYVSTSFDMGSAGGSGGAGRDYFDPSMFSLIEILKGGGSSLYGSDAMGGVVTLKTLEAGDLLNDQKSGGLVRGQYFSVNDSYAGQLGGAVQAGDFRFMMLYSGREGHETENHGGSLKPNPVDFTSHSWLGKMDYAVAGHRFQMALERYERRTEIDTISAVRQSMLGGFNESVLNDQEMERNRVSARWEYEPAGGWVDQMEALGYWQNSSNQDDNRSRSKDLVIGGVTIPGRRREQTIDFDTEIYGVLLQSRKELKTGDVEHQWLGGIDLSQEHSESAFDRVDTGNVQDTNRTPFAPADTLRLGMYLQDELKLGRKWSVTPGFRADFQRITPEMSQDYRERVAALQQNGQAIELSDEYDNLAISPRLDIAYMPTASTRVYGTYSRGIRNPTAEELSMLFVHQDVSGGTAGTVSLPNPDLKEETSHSLELGFKGDGDPGRFQIAGFYTWYEDFIENNVFTGEVDEDGREIHTTVNRGKATIYGLEVSGEANVRHWIPALDGFKVGLHSGIAIGRNETDHTWLNSVEPWKSSAFLGYDHPDEKFGVRLTGTYVDRVRHVDDTIPETGSLYRPEAYFVVDLGGYWKPTDTLTINGGINNLLDEKYWSWSSSRRSSSGSTGNFGNERNTAPGTNFYLSITQVF